MEISQYIDDICDKLQKVKEYEGIVQDVTILSGLNSMDGTIDTLTKYYRCSMRIRELQRKKEEDENRERLP